MSLPSLVLLLLIVSLFSLTSHFCQAADGGTLRGVTPSAVVRRAKATNHDRISRDRNYYQSQVQQRLQRLQEQQRKLDLLNDYDSPQNVQCSDELAMEITCKAGDDCNFSNRPGTCESKMFQYHGGACRRANLQAATARSMTSDIEDNCQDYHGGPPSLKGQEVFVVVSDSKDATKRSSMWVAVGDYFWTDYQDYPVGANQGLSDTQNITVYASDDDLSFDNMLQTTLFYAPCEGTEHFLDRLYNGQSVQLIGTAVDPTIQANFEIHISSLTDKEWQLRRVTLATSADPPFQVLPLSNSQRSVIQSIRRVPYSIQLDRTDPLSILATASVMTATGLECRLSAFYASDKPVIAFRVPPEEAAATMTTTNTTTNTTINTTTNTTTP